MSVFTTADFMFHLYLTLPYHLISASFAMAAPAGVV
jgi:hypothetical protein